MIIGGKVFKNYTYVMAIINLTPDSFFKDSRACANDVLYRVESAVKNGASVIDLGAQSTRPGYTEVSAKEELSRLYKPLTDIKSRFDIPVSVDTYFTECAKVALELGADMINDVRGLASAGMAEAVARKGAAVCIMHNQPDKVCGDVFSAVIPFLKEAAAKAVAAGVSADKICVDGGVGFAKDREQNLALINNYERLKEVGYPLLLGTSRKSVFGGDVGSRLPATLESTRLAARKGVLFVRVHDVKENAQVIREEYEGRRN